jgi:hypothetical protein
MRNGRSGRGQVKRAVAGRKTGLTSGTDWAKRLRGEWVVTFFPFSRCYNRPLETSPNNIESHRD